jgi:predicted RNA-binding protein Jag
MEEASTITKAIENAWNRAGQPQEFTVKILELPKTSFFGLKTSKSAKIALIFNETTVKAKEQAQQSKHVRPVSPRQPQDRREAAHTDRTQQPQRRPLPQRPDQRERDTQRDGQRAERTQDGRPSHNARPDQSDQRRPQQGQRPSHRPEDSMRRDETRRPERAPERMHDRGPERSSDRTMERAQERTFERDSWSPEMVDAAQDWIKETLVMMGKPDIKINAQVSHNYLKLYLDQPVMDDFKQEETQLKSWGSLAMESVREKVNKPLRSLRIVLESKK